MTEARAGTVTVTRTKAPAQGGAGAWASVAFYHAVAHAHLGEDIVGLGGVLLYFPADIGHVHPEYLVVALALGAPELLHDEVIGEHLAGAFAQQGHYLVFVLGEAAVLPGDEHLVLVVVDGQLSGGELAGVGNGLVAQAGAGVADGHRTRASSSAGLKGLVT